MGNNPFLRAMPETQQAETRILISSHFILSLRGVSKCARWANFKPRHGLHSETSSTQVMGKNVDTYNIHCVWVCYAVWWDVVWCDLMWRGWCLRYVVFYSVIYIYIMLSSVLLRCVMFCYVMLCCVVLCYVMLCMYALMPYWIPMDMWCNCTQDMDMFGW